MGNFCSESVQRKSSVEVQEQDEKPSLQSEVKLMLYGTGEAGKTTILRQMMISADGEAGDKLLEELDIAKGFICLNILETTYFTIRAGRQHINIQFDDEDSRYIEDKYREVDHLARDNARNINLDDEKLANAIINTWKNPKFKQVLEHRGHLQVYDGFDFHAARMANDPGYPKWGGKDWTPAIEDLLHSRIRTIGAQKVSFSLSGGLKFSLIDVGGQRSERFKHTHLFRSIDAVLFVVSLSEYDQELFEEEGHERLGETIKTWVNALNNEYLKDKWFLVFLNKVDLFKQKYLEQRIPITTKCDVHEPPPLVEDDDEEASKAINWFEELMMSKASPEMQEQIRFYNVTALDSEDVKEKMELAMSFYSMNLIA